MTAGLKETEGGVFGCPAKAVAVEDPFWASVNCRCGGGCEVCAITNGVSKTAVISKNTQPLSPDERTGKVAFQFEKEDIISLAPLEK